MNDCTSFEQLLEFAQNPIILTTLDDLESVISTDELPLFIQPMESNYAN